MKLPRPLHRWPTTARAAIALQTRLAPLVRFVPIPARVRLQGGIDVAFSRDGREVVAGIVVWDAFENRVVDQSVARVPVRFPYVPGLLSFREIPGVLAAARRLRTEPQVFFCDGQGVSHPRRFGLASHTGVLLGRPTIGCAKSRLCGTFDEPAAARGSVSPLWDRSEQVGVVLRTRDGVKPLFLSAGHLCDLPSAITLTLAAATRYRLPEPARLAHQLVTRMRIASSE
jgi:deoxyribonuclease V